MIFLKRNKIQRVTCSHCIAFSKWAKDEGYIYLRVTIPLLFKDSLKSQTWLFSYRSFAGPLMIFKFSHREQIWGWQSIYWTFLRVKHFGNAVEELSTKYQWKLSSNMNFSHPNLWKNEKISTKFCHQMLSGNSKNYAVSLLCNITQIWQLLSVSARNIIHLAVIWVEIWGIHKNNYSGAILRITPEMECY